MAPFSRAIRPSDRWVNRQRRRRRSPLLRLLDHSFRLRLALAVFTAMVALGAVNRYALCRDHSFAPGCLWRDAGGVVEVANLEAFSIVTVAVLYVLEGGKRRQRDHLEAHQVLLACREAGVRYAPARNDALELLCAAGLEFHGWDLSGADVRGADLRGADLSGATLQAIRWDEQTQWPGATPEAAGTPPPGA